MDVVIECMQTIFGGAWDIMTSVEIPGFNMTAAQFAIGFFVIKWSLNLLGLVTGFRTNVGNAAYSLRSSTESARHYKTLYAKKGGNTP